MSASASGRAAVPPGRQPGVVAEDGGLETPDRVARLEAELVERRPVGVKGRERVCVTARRVERPHQELAGPLAQRVLPDERLELRDDVGRPPELDVGGDPLLARGQPQLVEAPGLGLRPLFESELGERRAAPEVERAQEEGTTLLRPAALASASSCSKRRASICSAVTASTYPGGRVTMTSGPSAFLSATTAFCSDAVAFGGGSAP